MENIWENLNFTENKEESAYDLLINQSVFLEEKTSKELQMTVEAVDTYLDGNPSKLAALYMLYIVVPKLGNYRKKILTVVEKYEDGRFPVRIISHLDNEEVPDVNKDVFFDNIEKILTKPIVKRSIENLYKQSKEIK